MMQRKTVLKIIVFIVLAVLITQPSADPDLGWHLRYGEYFFQTGHVLRDNIISFVWPQYKWVQASWGFDLLSYQVFSHFGFFGLSVAATLLTLLSFFILTYPQKRLSPLQMFYLGIIFIGLASPMWGGALRTPSLSTVFMALAIVLADTAAFVYLPFLFFVWSNVHGGFSLGLILLTIQWGTYGLLLLFGKTSKRRFFWFGLALLFSWLTPLINPWGSRVYEETFKHASNVNLSIISEWTPLWNLPVERFVTGIVVLFTLGIAYLRKKIALLPYVAMICAATYLAYSANRFVIVLSAVLVYFLARNLPEIKSRFFGKTVVQVALALILVAVVTLDLMLFKKYFSIAPSAMFSFTWNDYCYYTSYCSEEITSIMLKDPPKGHGYHPFNYGGYLSWRVPQVQTFIDGRMPAWEENGKTPPAIEGDWISMTNGVVAFKKFDSEYHFTWVIVPTPADIRGYFDDLSKNHLWERKYQDDFYSYYVKL